MPRPCHTAGASGHCVRTAALLGLSCFVIFLTNLRVMAAGDSIPARLLPFSILRQGNLDLNEFDWLRRVDPEPYFMNRAADGRWRSSYPITTPVLVTPLWVPVVWWLHRQEIEDDDVRFRLVSVVMERVAAALIAATSASLLFLAAGTVTSSSGMAMAITLVYALGTNTWATSSQALWQHGLAELALAGLSLSLLLPAAWRHTLSASAFAGLAVLARPTMAIFAALSLVFIWRERRAQLPWFVGLPIVGLILLLAFDVGLVSGASAAFAHTHFVAPESARLVGLLLSPSRGLLVYTPAAALAFAGMLHPGLRAHGWLRYLALGVAGYLLLYSSWQGWWGGHCYGPRFLTDALPALALCALPAVERLWRKRLARPALLALAAWGVIVQVIGVYCDDRSWDALPRSVDVAPERLWDWRDPQIVRAARAGWHGADLAPLLWQTLTAARPAYLKLLSAADLSGEVTTEQTPPLHYRRDSFAWLDVHIMNRGGMRWPAFSDYGMLQVAINHRWWSNGTMIDGVGGLIPLPRNLDAGESMPARIRIETPPRPGLYELELLVVQGLNVHQGAFGGAVLRLPVQID